MVIKDIKPCKADCQILGTEGKTPGKTGRYDYRWHGRLNINPMFSFINPD
jgi:hypothetical protein